MTRRRRSVSAREQRLLGTIEALEVRLREVHHRVRRQLQTISTLLNMQAERSRDQRVGRALADAATRIQTIATIDDQLRDPATAAVEMSGAIRAIGDLAQTMLGAAAQPVSVRYYLDEFALPADQAIQCGLVVNELVTNALQHGFKGQPGGHVEVRAVVRDGLVSIEVHDDGVGPPSADAAGRHPGLGLDLVRLLVTRQLHGEFLIARDAGTRCKATFSYPAAAQATSTG